MLRFLNAALLETTSKLIGDGVTIIPTPCSRSIFVSLTQFQIRERQTGALVHS